MFSKERKAYQGFNLKGRLKALGIHLIFSTLIFAVFLYVMLVYWYPAPHFQINGGWQGLKIMIPIDFIIGPFLTFCLVNPRKGKKELTLDLSLVAIIQIALLIYGIDKVYSQRPAAQVLSHRGYIATPRQEDLLYQNSVNPQKIIVALNVLNTYPPTVYSVFEDFFKQKKNNDLIKDQFTFKKDESKGNFNPEMIVSRYRALNSLEAQTDIANAAEKAAKRFAMEPENQTAIDTYKDQHGDQFYFFPLRGEYGDAVMVLNKLGKPVDYFNIKLLSE